MKTFLSELAEQLLLTGQEDFSDTTVIFPNKRAGVFFRKALAAKNNKPIWAPEILSLQEFITGLSDLVSADILELNLRLFRSYQKYNKTQENFEQFYFWGQMLLKDFDEVDKNLVDPKLIFSGIKYQKEIEKQFFLAPEQIELINQFWSGFGKKLSDHQTEFLFIWERLFDVYSSFKHALRKNGLAYEGMIYRDVAESFNKVVQQFNPDQKFILAGFNALSIAEEKIVRILIEKLKARIFWDLDKYYLDDQNQEAGHFMRKYKADKMLKSTFSADIPDYFRSQKKIQIIECTQQAGQVKLACEMLQAIATADDFIPEATVMVLPDEQLLQPLLNSLPPSIERFNVTMGYSFKNTMLYELVQSLFDLQITFNKGRFHHKPVLSLLQHPFLMLIAHEDCTSLISMIRKKNQIWLNPAQLQPGHELLGLIFQAVKGTEEWFDYITSVVGALQQIEYDNAIEKEFLFHFRLQIKRLGDIFRDSDAFPDLKPLIRLFNQVAGSLRLPFSGEPLQGLQIMGMLETRNLDFENVFIFSMNEGQFPAKQSAHSFIPYNLRKAFHLTTVDQQDAIYSYIFYRLIQRAKNVYVFFQSNSVDPALGEKSRFLQQLTFESGLDIEEMVMADPVDLPAVKEIEIKKDQEVYQLLDRFRFSQGQSEKRLTPSALSTYLDCRLKFYFNQLVRIYEPDEVNDDIDARAFGNLLHSTIEKLYADFINKKGSAHFEKSDFAAIKNSLDPILLNEVGEYFGSQINEASELEGKVLLIYKLVRKFAARILDVDHYSAPFEIIALEYNEQSLEIEISGPDGKSIEVGIKGVIDRIDRKDGKIRIIDYKTGKDLKQISELSKLFDREEKRRNKAAMQVMLYALMQSKVTPEAQVVPGLYNSKELFEGDFDCRIQMKPVGKYKYQPLDDISEYEEEFMDHLKELLEEIWDPAVSFDQTDDWQKCQYCPYAGICHRD